MNKSEQINELASALCKAQSMIKGAKEDSTNPHFRSRYASLQSYIDSAREPLHANGLSVTQLLTDINCESMNLVSIETILMHSSGQWLSSVFSVPVSKVDAQGFGSAVTYARRYSFAAIVGIAPIDDDGTDATASAPKVEPKPEKQKVTPNKKAEKPVEISDEVRKTIAGITNVEKLREYGLLQTHLLNNPEFVQLVKDRKEQLTKETEAVK